MSFKLVRLQERLAFLSRLLTKPGVEEEVSHFDRLRLIEEVEELDEKLKEERMKEAICH